MPSQNVPQLVLANAGGQQGQQTQTVPRLITNIAAIQPQQTTSSNQVQIRPVLTAVPQGGGQLTLIQRPGQQPQLVQQIVQPQTIQKTIITRPAQVVQVQQTQQAAQQGQQVTVQTNAANNAAGQRRGLSLSVRYLFSSEKLYFDQNYNIITFSQSTLRWPVKCLRRRTVSRVLIKHSFSVSWQAIEIILAQMQIMSLQLSSTRAR